jgi:hypothetical protein
MQAREASGGYSFFAFSCQTFHWRAGLSASFIWVAHIGLDRMLGYGLKYPTAFAIRI